MVSSGISNLLSDVRPSSLGAAHQRSKQHRVAARLDALMDGRGHAIPCNSLVRALSGSRYGAA